MLESVHCILVILHPVPGSKAVTIFVPGFGLSLLAFSLFVLIQERIQEKLFKDLDVPSKTIPSQSIQSMGVHDINQWHEMTQPWIDPPSIVGSTCSHPCMMKMVME